jgi:serine/threonine protein kinase
MSPSIGCLEEHELLILLSGESASEPLRAHLHDCPACRSRLNKLRSELAAIRLTGPVSTPSNPVPTDRDPDPAPFYRSQTSTIHQSTVASTETLPSNNQTWTNGESGPVKFEGNERAAAEETPILASIGKYLVVGRFPRSGQAQVFRVVHPELRRDLVLKLANQPMDEDGRSDILVDGQRLAELEHPNIVRVHDLDFHEGRPYLIMEYIRGRTLAQYVHEESVSPWQSAALVAEIAGAVAFAHGRGIVHQDIKPANVLIDEAGWPRLIDFGLSWQQDAWSGPSISSEGGTYSYMAPEQARVELDRVRPLSDVFAVGALLYFLLTGKGPFEAATPAESWERARRCDFDPSALKKAGVPRWLERICLKALAADPRSRYPSADALRRAIESYLLTRRAAPLLGAVAILLALLVPVWAFWPESPRTSPNGPGRTNAGQVTTQPQSEPKHEAPVNLRVTLFEIPHFSKLSEDQYDLKRSGLLGKKSYAARLVDDVTVQAKLSEPAYSYLIAYRPDGTDQLCDPDDEDVRPPRKDQPVYPSPAKSEEKYRLNEGAGLYAFALVVSHKPLPSYREWKRLHGKIAWSGGLTCEPGVVWRDDELGLQPLLADNPAGTRGKGARSRGSGEPVAKLATWLRGLPDVDVVTLEAFPVEPASRP